MKTYVTTILLLLCCMSEGQSQQHWVIEKDSNNRQGYDRYIEPIHIIINTDTFSDIVHHTYRTIIINDNRIPRYYRVGNKFIEYTDLSIVEAFMIVACICPEEVLLKNTTHGYLARIQYNSFEKPTYFSRNVFNNSLRCMISGNTFYDMAFFDECNFNVGVFIAGNTFKNRASFEHTAFHDTCNFSESIVSSTLSFKSTFFNKTANFSGTTIEGKLDFSNARFCNKAIFRSLTLKDTSNLIFKNAVLPDTIDFSYNTDLATEIDLTIANFTDLEHYDYLTNNYYPKKKHLISLYKSDLSKFNLDYIHFRLDLRNPDNNHKIFNFDETCSQYEALLKNFKDRGKSHSYELCDIEYQSYIWRKKSAPLKYLGFVPKYWNNYGYDKSRVFLWMFAFLTLFTICTFFFAYDTLTKRVYTFNTIPDLPHWKYIWTSPRKFKLLGTRLWYSFVYTASVFYLISLKVDKMRYHNKGAVLYLMLMYITGIICLAYMANYIITR